MRHSIRYSFAFLAAYLAPSLADYLGPRYAAPRDLSSKDSLVTAAWNNITDTLNLLLDPDLNTANPPPLPVPINATQAQNVTFSLGLFSLRDPAASTLQFHHTSPGIATAPNGTQKVNADSVYRIASVTKVFTVLAGLLELDNEAWDRPLNQVLPALGLNDDSSALSTPWDQITMRALAAQIGGVPRDGFPGLGELALLAMLDSTTDLTPLLAASGLPPPDPLDPLHTPPCQPLLVAGNECPPVEYAQGVAARPPAFYPWTTPGYANNGFALLGLAIGNATAQPISDIYRSRIFEPLGLGSTTAEAPPPSQWSHAVIVGDPTASGFVFPDGVFVSTGGLFSSLHDLARFGIGILNSTLLPAVETRRWLKPVSHTDKLTHAVGAPWEIVRHADDERGTVTDVYTKNGDSGLYSSLLALVPDYDVGFSLLAGSDSSKRSAVASAVADLVLQRLMPAVRAQAEREAEVNFAGWYRGAPGTNSSLRLGVDDAGAGPGVVVREWESNGVDVLAWLPEVFGKGPFRLVPSVTDKETGGSQVAFRLVAADAPLAEQRGLLSDIPDWVTADVSTYYGIGLSLFVFDLDGAGKATAVSPAAWRVKLSREE